MPTVTELQEQQRRVLSALRGTVELRGEADPAVETFVEDYSRYAAELRELLGPGAHCNDVNPILWDSYRETFRERTGVYPVFATADQARAYVNEAEMAPASH